MCSKSAYTINNEVQKGYKLHKIKYFNLYVSLVIATVFIVLYGTNLQSIQKFNNNFIDMFFNMRGEINASKDIVIIDVDERSLKALGRWPWRRDKIAKVVDNLTEYGVGVIGFDMVFAEEDGSSPKKIAKELGIKIENAKDYDEIFAKSIENSPSILGFVLNVEQNFSNYTPTVNGIFVERGKGEESFIPTAKGVTSNIEILQNSAYSSGSFNMFPDPDGVVRYVPMLFSLDGTIYPSLSLEMIRVALGEKMVFINYDEFGIDNIEIGNLKIPTDENGRLFINFAGPKNSYHYISALDVYEKKADPLELKGKIVLIGTSASGLLDLRATPFDQTIPGVEIHANAIDNIINGNFIQKPSNVVGINYIQILIFTLLAGVILTGRSVFISAVASLGFIVLVLVMFYFLMFKYETLVNFIYPILSIFVTILVLFITKLFFESRQKEQILNKFSKKVSPAVAETLIKSGNVDFNAEDKEVTIFFSDVRNFTTISEGFESAHDLIDYLNRYMSPMSEVIIKNSGTIDKYIGDAIMAYWNAPLEVKDHADRAVSSALEQLEKLDILNEEFEKQNLPLVHIGIGIHTGEAVVGEMGSVDRSDYTIIGDSVNIASRVEGLCKQYKAEVLITQQTKDRLKKNYNMKEIGSVSVKGKKEPVTIYQVLRN
jgi:adenylate cyclase